ncbi:hypothetical protein [Actinacidiphila bryophytorum]|uniref:Uncharacterized protein n=1 Tax=Actinacidiphila bryophytorum TaxID=1436133 RepID=A0A9W4E5W8_9ACTN|nr:hypothetical protein [Actinacidiphila bryophytorum]MBM9437943.1 hypothetical protein [Actinacidiphila bryophytorum]MBN6543125.1 hypothetical protein [Actinacidiphila bryophytorum]CAG7623614.1 conserved exported hypothetical protein [Actinacidiphila bryophytorum]
MTERSRWRRLLVPTAIAATALAGVIADTGTASAATSQDFGPTVVTGIPAAPPVGTPATQLVVPMATVSTPVTAGRTAYVYSELRAYDADQVNLVDNEVRCSGAGASNVVMGENVLPPTGDPAHRDITVVTRFLVSATSTGTLNCTLYLRTASTSSSVAQETVSGTLRFASTSVGEDTNGLAMQQSLPVGELPVTTAVTAPVVDRTLPPGYSQLAVIADVEYHRCAGTDPCTANYSTASFTLTATTSGGSSCASAPPATTQESVPRGVNHAAIPLYTIVTLAPGCTHVHAQVTTTHVAGDTGSVGAAAAGLTDSTGQAGSTPNHTSAMTHLFVVPS